MAIRLEVQPYCESCCDFEADVTKPEKKAWYCEGEEFIAYASDTIVRCRYAKRCEAIKRYLSQQKEDK